MPYMRTDTHPGLLQTEVSQHDSDVLVATEFKCDYLTNYNASLLWQPID